MRVLMIGPDRNVHGGISMMVNYYYEAGLDKKIDLIYVATMKEGSKLRKLVQALKAYLIFCGRIKNADIVHVNMASDSSYLRKSFFIRKAKRAGKKIVIHQHGGNFDGYYQNLSEKKKETARRILAMGDALVVLAPVWKEFFSKLTDSEKIVILPNAIPIPPRRRKDYRAHRILFLGRICREKGIEELLEAVTELRKDYPEVKLYLGGVFEDDRLRQKVNEMSEYVTFLSWVSGEKKKKVLSGCDIFALPSYFEGQPISLVEAMAYSCAVVASDTGGIPLMLEGGKCGILVAPKDAVSLRKGLETMIKDPEYARVLGERARERIETEFSIEKNMERLLEIYRNIG